MSELKVYKHLNNKAFNEIREELQDKVKYWKIRTITFEKESYADLRFEIFKELNKATVPLNEQELRNCFNGDSYCYLLKELAQDRDFIYLLNLKTLSLATTSVWIGCNRNNREERKAKLWENKLDNIR